MEKIRNVSDLRLMFHRNERPIYFISATNFNLLGIDQWFKPGAGAVDASGISGPGGGGE